MTATVAGHSAAAQWGLVDWAMVLTVALAVLILLGIVAARVIYRGAQTEGGALWLHLLTLGIFPLCLLGVGNLAIQEYVQEKRFCATCHLTMKPYIDDLHDPKGKSLAALHFQHRFKPDVECYACHTNYGLSGYLEAKLTGLRHVYKYTTRTFELPIRMREPFANVQCLKCHDGAKRFVEEELHMDGERVSEALRRDQTSCGKCHKPAHRIPARAGTGRSAG